MNQSEDPWSDICVRFVPPQRWLASVERGAVVMLYHPCTPPDTVDMLRTILTGCMRWGGCRYVQI